MLQHDYSLIWPKMLPDVQGSFPQKISDTVILFLKKSSLPWVVRAVTRPPISPSQKVRNLGWVTPFLVQKSRANESVMDSKCPDLAAHRSPDFPDRLFSNMAQNAPWGPRIISTKNQRGTIFLCEIKFAAVCRGVSLTFPKKSIGTPHFLKKSIFRAG